jgi:hypothetical protein
VLSVGNSGSTTLIVGSVSVGGAAASDFHASGCAGANVAPGSSCAVNIRFAPTGEGTREATLTIADDTGAARTVSLQGMGLGTSQVPVQQVPVQQVTPQPAVPAVAKPALLAGPAAVRAKRVGRTVVVRVSLSLGEPAAVDVSALRGAKRFTLLKGSRVGAYRTNARSRTIAAGVDVAGPLAVELRLPAGEVRKGRLYRIVVHARGSAGAAASLTTTFRL